jgi:hypothetical protein
MAMLRPVSRAGMVDTSRDRPKRRKALLTDVVLEGALSPGQPGYNQLKDAQEQGQYTAGSPL